MTEGRAILPGVSPELVPRRQLGRDLERRVLVRAVRCEDRSVVHVDEIVVFP